MKDQKRINDMLHMETRMFVVAVTILAGILIGYTIVRPEPNL